MTAHHPITGPGATEGPAKSAGQLVYEADVQKRPNYHKGSPRKTWDQLGEVERWSWGRSLAARSALLRAQAVETGEGRS